MTHNTTTKDNLYRKGLGYVHQYAKSYSHFSKVDRQELEEAGEIGMMCAVDRYDEHKGGFSTFVKGYIYQYIKNRAINVTRDKHKLVSLDYMLHQPATKEQHTPADYEMKQVKINKARVLVVLKNATKKERVVLEMIMSGKSQTETAKELGCHRNTIASIIKGVKIKCGALH